MLWITVKIWQKQRKAHTHTNDSMASLNLKVKSLESSVFFPLCACDGERGSIWTHYTMASICFMLGNVQTNIIISSRWINKPNNTKKQTAKQQPEQPNIKYRKIDLTFSWMLAFDFAKLAKAHQLGKEQWKKKQSKFVWYVDFYYVCACASGIYYLWANIWSGITFCVLALSFHFCCVYVYTIVGVALS